MKDLIDELHAVTRRVGDATPPAGDAKVVSLARTYRTDPDDLWDALTNPERIPRWFLPVSGDLRLGGTYQLEGNAGGEIRVCEAPRHLQLTWVFGEAPPESSLVDVHLSPDADGVALELVGAAESQVAADREEPARDALGVREGVPQVVGVGLIDPGRHHRLGGLAVPRAVGDFAKLGSDGVRQHAALLGSGGLIAVSAYISLI